MIQLISERGKAVNMPIDPLARSVVQTINDAGYDAYFAGGCVRDLYMGITPHDWDITTSALPQQIMDLFPGSIPTGIKHGTITVRVEDSSFEVTTFRTEGPYLDSRHPAAYRLSAAWKKIWPGGILPSMPWHIILLRG